MRTTVELPPELMRAAKARSAEAGESLKAMLTRAVEAELGQSQVRPALRGRVVLPLFGSATGPRANPSNADLERALAEADATMASRPAQPTRRGRRSPSRRAR